MNAKYVSIIALIYIYVNIGLFLCDYNNVWAQPEEFNWREYILKDGAALSLQDIVKAFNWQVFEFEPRCTRPLSSYFEILDTKFRAFLWQVITPHPSFSLTWIFLLVLSPLFFFKLLRQFDIKPSLATLMTGMYVANPATMSLLAVDFRPAKALADFSIIFWLYVASKLRKPAARETFTSFAIFLLFCAGMYGSFFWDETALLAYPAVAFFFPEIIFCNKKRLLCFLALPILVAAAYFSFIPTFSSMAGFEYPQLGAYSPFAHFTTFPDMSRIFSFFAFADLLTNAQIFLSDSFGLVNPALSPSRYYKIMFGLTVISISWVLLQFVVDLYQRRKNLWTSMRRGITRKSSDHADYSAARFFRSGIFLVIVTLFANILLHSVENPIWGLNWLNTYWAIFWLLFLAILLNRLPLNTIFLAVAVCVIANTSLYNFGYVNYAFKSFFYYRAVEFSDVIVHKVNRFSIPRHTDSELFTKTAFIWKAGNNYIVIPEIPTELYYLVHDLRLIEPGTQYTRRFSVFNGYIRKFALIKPNKQPDEKFIVVPYL